MKIKKFRREDAIKRNKVWNKLSLSEQLKALDDRLGKNVGAKRQRARIQAEMDKKE